MAQQVWRIWLCVFCLCFCCLGTGCSDSNSQSVNPEVIHLTLWQGINPPPNREVFQKLVNQFNRTHPQIQVESLYVGQADQQLPKILTAVLGNTPPDLLWYGSMLTGKLVELGAIRPLDDWWATLRLRSQIDPALLEGMKLHDHLWSVPMATNNVALFYRPSLFAAAGIEHLPTTWDEFLQVTQQLTRDRNGDGRPEQYGVLLPLGKGEWTVFTWLPFLFSAQGDLLAQNQPHLLNSGAIAALQFWQDLMQRGVAKLSAPERGYELDEFLAGRVAMQLTGPWTLGQLQQTQVDFGVIPIPRDRRQATVVGGENFFVFNSTPEREQAALTFLEFISSPSFQLEWSLETGYLPVNLQVRKSQEYQTFIAQQPSLKVFLEQAQFARSRPTVAGYSRLSDALGRAIEAVLLGASPESALQHAQNRLELDW